MRPVLKRRATGVLGSSVGLAKRHAADTSDHLSPSKPHRTRCWSKQQAHILSGGGRAEALYTADRGYAFKQAELPHHHLLSRTTAHAFASWRDAGVVCTPSIVGAWRRVWFEGGGEKTTEADENCFNLQTPTVCPAPTHTAHLSVPIAPHEFPNSTLQIFIDMRLPTDRPRLEGCHSLDDLTEEELRQFARQHAFCGYTVGGLVGRLPLRVENSAPEAAGEGKEKESMREVATACDTTSRGKSYVGCEVHKYFDGHGLFAGKVVAFHKATGYRVKYEDGDQEDMSHSELLHILRSGKTASPSTAAEEDASISPSPAKVEEIFAMPEEKDADASTAVAEGPHPRILGLPVCTRHHAIDWNFVGTPRRWTAILRLETPLVSDCSMCICMKRFSCHALHQNLFRALLKHV